MTTERDQVRIAPSNSPLYGKTFICKGYGKPIRPPEKGTSIERRVGVAPSNSPLYGQTFICRGYGKPTRPTETVEEMTQSGEVEKTQDSVSDKDEGGKS